MRIVVACPSALKDGANLRQQINATLCPYMAAVRGYLPPNNADEPLIDIGGMSGSQRVWLLAQVWDVEQSTLKELKSSVSERNLQLRLLEDSLVVAPTERLPRGAGRGAVRYTVSNQRDYVYAVSRHMESVEQVIVAGGLQYAWKPTSVSVLFPTVAGGGSVVHTHRQYLGSTDNETMFNDVMQRIHESQRGNET